MVWEKKEVTGFWQNSGQNAVRIQTNVRPGVGRTHVTWYILSDSNVHVGPAQVSNFIPKKWINIFFVCRCRARVPKKILRAGGGPISKAPWHVHVGPLVFSKPGPNNIRSWPTYSRTIRVPQITFFFNCTSRLRTIKCYIMPNHTIFIAWTNGTDIYIKTPVLQSSSVICAVPHVFGPPWPAFFRKPGPHSCCPGHFPASGAIAI